MDGEGETETESLAERQGEESMGGNEEGRGNDQGAGTRGRSQGGDDRGMSQEATQSRAIRMKGHVEAMEEGAMIEPAVRLTEVEL